MFAGFVSYASLVLSVLLQAIAYMGDDFMFQLFGKYRDMALAVKNPCHLNMAACLIKLKRYEEAIGHCGLVSEHLEMIFFVCTYVMQESSLLLESVRKKISDSTCKSRYYKNTRRNVCQQSAISTKSSKAS